MLCLNKEVKNDLVSDTYRVARTLYLPSSTEGPPVHAGRKKGVRDNRTPWFGSIRCGSRMALNPEKLVHLSVIYEQNTDAMPIRVASVFTF